MSDTIEGEIIERDSKGRFLSGTKPGPGRKLGSRNRHTENFLTEFADDFEKHGAAVIAKVRVERPEIYLRIACDLLPRHAELDVDVHHAFTGVGDVLEAFRLATDLLGTDPGAGLKRLQRLGYAAER
jgi:hypothetical protein